MVASVVLLGIGVALEITVRIVAPQDLLSDVVELGGPICHRLEPGARGVQRSGEYAVDIQINEQGLRDHLHPYEKRGDVFRILMLGDSHTYGWGVTMDEAFPQVLEESLNTHRSGSRTYEVINAGAMGFGTGHQYQFLTAYGLQFKPDLVVMAVDFVHDVIANNERYTIEGGIPSRNSRACVFEGSRSVTSYIPFADALRGRSHAFRFVGTNAMRLVRAIGGPRVADADSSLHDGMDLVVTNGLVQATKRLLDERATEFAVVILPEFREHEKTELRAFEDSLKARDIAFVSLGPRFGDDFYPSESTFVVSPHFNSSGHRRLAEEIRRFLELSGKI